MIGENDCTDGDVPILPQMDNATLCGSAEYSCYHFDVTDEMPHTAVLRTIAWVNWGLAFISTFCGVIYIYTRWIKELAQIYLLSILMDPDYLGYLIDNFRKFF